MLTPEIVKRALIERPNVEVAFMVDEAHDVIPAGKVVSSTRDAKTVKTDRGYVFKHRWQQERFALKGNPGTSMMFLNSVPADQDRRI